MVTGGKRAALGSDVRIQSVEDPRLSYKPVTKERVKRKQRKGRAKMREDEANRKKAGAAMAHFGGLKGVAADREMLRAEALKRMKPFEAQLRAELGTSRSGPIATGASSYANLVKLFGDYLDRLEAGDVAGQDEQLARLDSRISLWINDRDHQDAGSSSRRDLLDALSDATLVEKAALAKQQGQERYLAASAATNTQDHPAVAGDYEGRFTVLTRFSGRDASDALQGYDNRAKDINPFDPSKGAPVDQKRKALASAYGLTHAEVSALYAYSDANYYFINPSGANDKKWMQDTFDNPKAVNSLGLTGSEDKAALALEGAGHAAVIQSALNKLPDHEGTLYRGAVRKLSELADLKLVRGAEHTFASHTSTSTQLKTPAGFAGTATATDVAVLWVYSRLPGKDINTFSANAGEGEVLVPMGGKVKILTAKEITTQTKPATAAEKAGVSIAATAGKVFVVTAVGSGKPKWTPGKPSTGT